MGEKFLNRFFLMSCIVLGLFPTTTSAQDWPIATQEAKAGARWWWLGSAINEQDLMWNMKEYATHGLGTLEITPLYGVQGNYKNDIDFLSPKWMELLDWTEDLGKLNHINIDMDCGTGWPFGGPSVTIDEAACKAVFVDHTADAKELKKEGISISPSDKNCRYAKMGKVMAYQQGENGNLTYDVTGYVKGDKLIWKDAPKGSWRIIAQYTGRTEQKVKRAAPGGQGWVLDHFDKNAVKNYLHRFDEAFNESGTFWPHSFFNDSYEVFGADWTPNFLQEFEKRKGYKLQEHFPELIAREGQTIIDYRETLGDLLYENFTLQWAAWAHGHNSTIRNQAHGSPANLIDLYAAVDIPEIEGFGLTDFKIKGLRTDSGFTRPNYSDLSMLKYAPSAAHITGKKLVSSETFTWLTEHFRTSLSQMKPDLDFMFTAGVNHMFYHGTCYSPKNERWPGWKFYASIDMSPTNSIWRDATYINKYIERCQSFLQWGQPDNDFLIYFPIYNLWAKKDKEMLMQFSIETMGEKAPEFKNFVLQLDKLGYSSDYISDRYLLSTSFANGSLQTAAGTKYKGLIIPSDAILTPTLKAHIDQLKSQGAPIFFGIDKDQLARVAKNEKMKTDNVNFSYIRRRDSTGYHYFIANLTPNDANGYELSLSKPFQSAILFDALTGSRYSAEITSDGKIKLPLRSGQSMIVETFNESSVGKNLSSYPFTENTNDEIAINGPWSLSFTEEHPKVSKTFKLPKLQTWENLDDDSAKITMGTGVYSTTFAINKNSSVRSKVWRINLGDVRESARVYLNDSLIGCAWSAPFTIDFSGSLLRYGINKLRIEVTNLPANRIAALDKSGYKWRKFNEINFVDINYKKSSYADWKPVPSGLNSEISIYSVR